MIIVNSYVVLTEYIMIIIYSLVILTEYIIVYIQETRKLY